MSSLDIEDHSRGVYYDAVDIPRDSQFWGASGLALPDHYEHVFQILYMGSASRRDRAFIRPVYYKHESEAYGARNPSLYYCPVLDDSVSHRYLASMHANAEDHTVLIRLVESVGVATLGLFVNPDYVEILIEYGMLPIYFSGFGLNRTVAFLDGSLSSLGNVIYQRARSNVIVEGASRQHIKYHDLHSGLKA